MRLIILPVLLIVIKSSLGQNLFPEKWLNKPAHYLDSLHSQFSYNPQLAFNPGKADNALLYVSNYAASNLRERNPNATIPSDHDIYKVSLYFSDYPKDSTQWITGYAQLLGERLQKLFAFHPELNNSKYKFELVPQTICKTELQAIKLFHGFALHYKKEKVKGDSVKEKVIKPEELEKKKPFVYYQKAIHRWLRSIGYTYDTAVQNALNKNNWPKSVAIMDWTGSMHPFSGQLIEWHLRNFSRSGLIGYTFFNDGDQTPDVAKKVGKTGGIYHHEPDEFRSLLNKMKQVREAGKGGDKPENDIEACLEALKEYPEAKHLILIADNASCVRDISLIKGIGKPVHVILANYFGFPNIHYLNLAYQTGGSFHTLSETFDFASDPIESILNLYGLKLNEAGKIVDKGGIFQRKEQVLCDY